MPWVGLAIVAVASSACRPMPPASSAVPRPTPEPVVAIVGATVIDGTGAPPMPDATVVIRGRYIRAVGPRRTVRVPAGAEVIDGRGFFVLPGFIDAGAMLSPPERQLPWDTTYVPHTTALAPIRAAHDSVVAEFFRTGKSPHPYTNGPFDTLVVRRATAALWHGVTTLRSYGRWRVLRAVRDSIRQGQLLGPRLVITGYVVGGFELGGEIPSDSIGARLTQYVDQRIDFLKYAGTAIVWEAAPDDWPFPAVGNGTPLDEYSAGPPYLVYSEASQRAIVAAAHRRGLLVEAHANTPEGLRIILDAGVDLVQHPELMLNRYVLSDDLVRRFVQQRTLCALLPRVSAHEATPNEAAGEGEPIWLRTGGENARKLIAAGCPVVVASGAPPGQATLEAIEGLVALGMTPMAALVAATRTGALAARVADQVGTVSPGKRADLVVLGADPLQDIKHIEQTAMVFVDGRRVPDLGKDGGPP